MTRQNLKLYSCCFFSICIFIIWPILIEGNDNEIKLKYKDQQETVLYKESHALLIGVSNYTNGWPKLPGVKKDIQAIAEILKSHGFNIILVEDPTHEQLNKTFDDFIKQYGHELHNRLLFYYAGHGFTARQSYGEDMGYITAADTPSPIKDFQGFLSKAMDMQQIEVFAKRIQSKHAIFVFDSCFSGSIFAMTRSVPENISYKTTKPVRQFITSGSADEEVPDVSIFRKMFVDALTGDADLNKDGYITGTELGEFLQDKIINYSKGQQHPQYGKIRNPKLDKGDVVFGVGNIINTYKGSDTEKQKIEIWNKEIYKDNKDQKKLPLIPLPSF